MPSPLQTFHVFGADFDVATGWDLIRWCIEVGGDEFAVAGIGTGDPDAEAFRTLDAAANPFRRPEAPRRHLSGPPESGLTFATDLWLLNDATVRVLQAAFPRGIFDYYPGGDAWFEDLEIYRGGEMLLGIITHESEGVLRITVEERTDLTARGFVVRDEGKWVSYE